MSRLKIEDEDNSTMLESVQHGCAREGNQHLSLDTTVTALFRRKEHIPLYLI